MYKGIGASAGIGIGNIVIIKEQSLEYTARTVTDVDAEIARINEAIDTFSAKTQAMAEDIKQRLGEKEAEILEGQLLMVMDPSLTSEMETLIKAGQCAESALETVCDMFIQVFSMAVDVLTNQRAPDVHDIKSRVV